MKNPVTLAGIEPATSRFVSQSLNHCATAVPVDKGKKRKYLEEICPSATVAAPYHTRTKDLSKVHVI